jgi:hypothetical protein
MTPHKQKEKTKKTNKLDFIQIKNTYASKDSISTERMTTHRIGENICKLCMWQ